MVGKEETFEAVKERILRSDIPWDTYLTAKLITGTDLQLLRRFDHRSREVQSALLEENGAAYAHTFLNVLRNVFKEETVEYTIALIHETLTVDKARAQMFLAPQLTAGEVFQPLLRYGIATLAGHLLYLFCFLHSLSSPRLSLLSSPSWFVQEATLFVTATLLSASGGNEDKDVVKEFIEYLCHQLEHPSHPTRATPACVAALSTVLRSPAARDAFTASQQVPVLAPLVAPASSQQQTQLVYDACLCVWLLSFKPQGIDAIVNAQLLPRLVNVAKASSKEKVVRVVVLTFSNLLAKGHLGSALVEAGLPKVVTTLKLQAWHDEDLKEALDALDAGLRQNLRVLSSFDKYRQEVASGALDWTPVHKDAAFWRENLAHFEENTFQVLKDVVALLSAEEHRTQAVACHDLGQFVAAHPSGRNIALDLKAKEAVLKLLDSPDAEVRKYALLTLQKLLLSAKYVSFLQ